MEKYEKLRKVGEGSYGKVYKAREKKNGRIVALKKIRIGSDEAGVPSSTMREVSLLHLLSQSVHIVRLLCVEYVPKKNAPFLYLVFEYLDMDLKKFIDRHTSGRSSKLIPPRTVKSFMYQLCKGVLHCHSHGVLHRDLKPQNILIDKKKRLLKIGDFGLGRAFSVPLKCYTQEVLTLWYRAPELLLGVTRYSTPVDIWSVGCIFAELACRKPLFSGDSEIQQLHDMFRVLGTPNEDIWHGVTKLANWHDFPQWKPRKLSLMVPELEPSGLDLLSLMLQYDPSKRVSAKDALSHPYFDDLDKEQF